MTEAEPKSVVTGRTMEEIAQNEDHVWNSKETAGTGQAWYRKVGRVRQSRYRSEDAAVAPLRSAAVEMSGDRGQGRDCAAMAALRND